MLHTYMHVYVDVCVYVYVYAYVHVCTRIMVVQKDWRHQPFIYMYTEDCLTILNEMYMYPVRLYDMRKTASNINHTLLNIIGHI